MLSLELANALSRDRRREIEDTLRARALREATKARRREERAAAVATPPTGLARSQPTVAQAR